MVFDGIFILLLYILQAQEKDLGCFSLHMLGASSNVTTSSCSSKYFFMFEYEKKEWNEIKKIQGFFKKKYFLKNGFFGANF